MKRTKPKRCEECGRVFDGDACPECGRYATQYDHPEQDSEFEQGNNEEEENE